VHTRVTIDVASIRIWLQVNSRLPWRIVTEWHCLSLRLRLRTRLVRRALRTPRSCRDDQQGAFVDPELGGPRKVGCPVGPV